MKRLDDDRLEKIPYDEETDLVAINENHALSPVGSSFLAEAIMFSTAFPTSTLFPSKGTMVS